MMLWLDADPPTFDWPESRHLQLENRALAIAGARRWPPTIANAAAQRYGFGAAAAIAIDPELVAALQAAS